MSDSSSQVHRPDRLTVIGVLGATRRVLYETRCCNGRLGQPLTKPADALRLERGMRQPITSIDSLTMGYSRSIINGVPAGRAPARAVRRSSTDVLGATST